MEPSSVQSWAQVGLIAAGTVALIVLAVGQLFRTMGSSYGSIISALQQQNADQEKRLSAIREEGLKRQTELEQLRDKVSRSDRDSEEKIKGLHRVTDGLSQRVFEVEQKTS